MIHAGQGRFLSIARLPRRLVWALATALAAVATWAAPASALTGDIDTVAGNGTFSSSGDGGQATAAGAGSIEGVFFSPAGLHLTEDAGPRVRFVDPGGLISTVAGGGVGDPGDGGSALEARLQDPEQVIRDRHGNLFFASGNRVRRVSAAGVISTVAGNGTAGFSGDGGQATSAQLNRPHGLALDLDGNLYIADNDNNRIRRVSPAGVIETVVGTGAPGYAGDGGLATAALIDSPVDVAIDSWGRLFVAENDTNVVRLIDRGSGIISTVAGTGTSGYSGDGGPATAAQLRQPQGLEVDGAGNLFIAEALNHVIRKVDTGGLITTVAGTGAGAGTTESGAFSGDGGPAVLAALNGPRDVSFDAATGDFYIADRFNHRVRRVQALGVPDPAPPVNFDAAAPSPNSDSTPTWEFSVASSQEVRYECRLRRGSTVVFDWAACASPKTYDLSGEPDGAYLLEVRSETVSGVGEPSSRGYDLDRATPSAPSIGSGPLSPGNNRNPSWTFSGETGAVLQCRLTRGSAVVSDWTGCLSPRSYDLSGEPDGLYTFHVRQTDGAGNTSAATTNDYELDTSAPGDPTIDSSPASPGNDTSPSWGFSGEEGSAFECRLRRGPSTVADWRPCSSPETFDLSAEPSATYTFDVRQGDAAGNRSAAASANYVLDVDGPGRPTIDSSPASPGNDPTPTWSFSGEAGAVFECRLARGATLVADWSACASPKTFALGAEPDGTYTFSVRQTDQAGTTGPAVTSDLDLDRAAPASPTITGSPGARGNATNPTWSFTAEAGTALECRLSRGATVLSDWASCTSPRSYDLSGEPDGVHTFAVRATDAAGNVGPDSSDAYDLDRTPPGAPTLSGGPGALGNDPTPSWAFEAEAGAATSCRLEREGAVLFDWAPCASPKTYDLSSQGDGSYRFRVRGTDATGNVGPDTQSSYELDRVAPATPAITSSPGPEGSNRTPAWTFEGEAGAVHECRLSRGSDIVSDWTTCSGQAAYDLAGQPDATYVFEVRGRDQATNTGGVAQSSYRLDTEGSNVAIESGPGPVGNASTPAWSFSGEAGARFECRLDRGEPVASDWGACTSPHGYDLSAQPDGAYTFGVRSRDSTGNLGGPAMYSYELDRVAPGAPSFTATPGAVGNNSSPRWEFSAEAGALAECSLARDGALVTAWEPCAGGRTFDLTPRGDGSYASVVRATDAAGNTGPSAESAYRLDATAPDAPRITRGPGARGERRNVSWAFTGEAGAAFECRLARGARTLVGWGSCRSPRQFDLSDSEARRHTFSVRARDAIGNLGAAARSDYTLALAPEEEEAPPREGPPSVDEPREPPARPRNEATPPPSDPGPAPPTPSGGGGGTASPSGSPGSGSDRPADGSEERKDTPEKKKQRDKRTDMEDSTAGGIPIDPAQNGGPGAPQTAERAVEDPKSLAERGLESLRTAAGWVGRNLDKTGFPLLLLLMVVGYLSVQNRLDRRDPKLALAPVHAEGTLEFLPPPSLRGAITRVRPPNPSQ